MGRSPCCAKEGLNRGAWSAKEDQILTNYIKIQGEGKWRNLPLKAGLNRCGKSCRLRWLNYLKPGIKRGNISADEEDLIIRLHKLLGNRWSLIAGRLPGRTDNEIKNYWNTTLSKRIGAPPLSETSKRNLAKGNHAKLSTQTTPTPPMVAIRTKARRISNLNPPFPNTDMGMKSVPQSAVQPPNAQLHEENDCDEGGDRYIGGDCDLDLDRLKFTYDDGQACGDGATREHNFTNELCSNEDYNLDVHGETTLDWLSKQLLEDHNMMNTDLSWLDSFLHYEECPNEDNHSVKG